VKVLTSQEAFVYKQQLSVIREQITDLVEALGYGVATAKIELPIEGMTCANCVLTIERNLNRMPGVEKVSVNLATEKASLVYNPAMVDIAEVKDLVEAIEEHRAFHDDPRRKKTFLKKALKIELVTHLKDQISVRVLDALGQEEGLEKAVGDILSGKTDLYSKSEEILRGLLC